MKILLTGATGFLGSHLTRRLLRDGFDVAIIKREKSESWRIADLLSKVRIYEGDLCDTVFVLEAASDFEPVIIFHLATYYAVEHTPEEVPTMFGVNVRGTVNLLEAAEATKAKLFVNTSSCFVYKSSTEPLREDSPLEPLNLYALTKIYAEQACFFYCRQYKVPCVTFRLFPPYGPSDHERILIPYLIRALFRIIRYLLGCLGLVESSQIGITSYFPLKSIPEIVCKTIPILFYTTA